MYTQLPAEPDKIQKRLITEWIDSRNDVDSQIEGCATIVSALMGALDPMIGKVATQAVLSRASALAKLKYPLLINIVITDTGFDVDHLKSELDGQSLESVREALAGLVDELFSVLYGLLGSSLLSILREVGAEQAEREASPPPDKEEP